jgi:hypothetical protein
MSDIDFKTVPPWLPIDPPSAKLTGDAAKLRAVINELDVEHAPRYRRTGTATWCNIYVTDVLSAMGLQPGHWMRKDGAPAQVGQGQEMNANALVRWFVQHGARFGWQEADRDAALAAAARGHTVVVGWDSGTGFPGHIAIVLPEGAIAQAGARNFVGETIRAGFGDKPVRFFVQMHGGSHGQ